MTQQEAEAPPRPPNTKRRRSTVREKVSFGIARSRDAGARAAAGLTPAPAPPDASAQPEPAPDADQPRRAGWWSRRFGGG